jgi:hypothetical protein
MPSIIQSLSCCSSSGCTSIKLKDFFCRLAVAVKSKKAQNVLTTFLRAAKRNATYLIYISINGSMFQLLYDTDIAREIMELRVRIELIVEKRCRFHL